MTRSKAYNAPEANAKFIAEGKSIDRVKKPHDERSITILTKKHNEILSYFKNNKKKIELIQGIYDEILHGFTSNDEHTNGTCYKNIPVEMYYMDRVTSVID